MPLVASKTTRPEVPEDSYPGRCIDVYDAGWWQKMKDPKKPDQGDEYVQKCKLVFVIDTSEAADFVDADGNPIPRAYVDLFETLTLGDLANLRKHLKSWRGKDLTSDELREFDLETMLGKTAMVQVVHKPRKDGTPRAVIGTLTPLHRSVKAPEVPASYVPDADRDKPFAADHPKPAAPKPAAAKPPRDAAEVLKDAESDDLPF